MKQSIGMQGIGNARELGGYRTQDGRRVKKGKLLRTAKLLHGTKEDFKRLHDVYRLGTVVDLRMEEEVAHEPDPDLGDVRYCMIPVLEEDQFVERLDELEPFLSKPVEEASRRELMFASIKAGIISHDMYAAFLSRDNGRKRFGEFFRELLALPEDRSILFHCSQGKDRTGLGAALILSVLGVDEQTIMSDYMLTNEYSADSIAEERLYLARHLPPGEDLEKYMIIMDQVDEETMRRGMDYMKREYGSVMGYVKDALHVDDAEIAALRKKFLE